jgi:hypothetical protein
MAVTRVQVTDRASKYFGKFKLTAADGRDLGYSSYTGTKPTATQTAQASIDMLTRKRNQNGSLKANDLKLAQSLFASKESNWFQKLWNPNSDGLTMNVDSSARKRFEDIHTERQQFLKARADASSSQIANSEKRTTLQTNIETQLDTIVKNQSGATFSIDGNTYQVPTDEVKKMNLFTFQEEVTKSRKELEAAQTAYDSTKNTTSTTAPAAHAQALEKARREVETLKTKIAQTEKSMQSILVEQNPNLKDIFETLDKEHTKLGQQIESESAKISENLKANNQFVGKPEKVKTPTPNPENPTAPPVNETPETAEAKKAREDKVAADKKAADEKKRQAERDEKNWWTQPFEDGEAWGIIGRLAAGASIVGPVAALLKWIFGGKQQPPQQ